MSTFDKLEMLVKAIRFMEHKMRYIEASSYLPFMVKHEKLEYMRHSLASAKESTINILETVLNSRGLH